MGSSPSSLLCLLHGLMSQITCPHFPGGETETLRESSSFWAFSEFFYQEWLGMRGAGMESPRPSGTATFPHRKSEAPGAFQARDEGRSQRPSQGQSQLRRQSSPAPSRQVSTSSHRPSQVVTASPSTLGSGHVSWAGRSPVRRAGPQHEIELHSLPRGQKLLARCEGLHTNPLKMALQCCPLGGPCYLAISESHRCTRQALGAASSSLEIGSQVKLRGQGTPQWHSYPRWKFGHLIAWGGESGK